MVLKRKKFSGKAASAKSAARKVEEDAALPSDDESSSDEANKGPDADEDDDDGFFETPDEKRVRVAKEYLGKLGETNEPEQVKEQIIKDKQEVERRARVQVEGLKLGEPRYLKGHKMAATCVCLSADERTAWSGGKDCALIRWDVETGQKDVFVGGRNQWDCGGHTDQVLSVCLVEHRQVLVSSGADKIVRIWDPRSPAKSSCVDKLQGHLGSVTATVAEPEGNRIYTASLDRSVKVWDLSTKRCCDTLLGHVGGIGCMDLYNKGRLLTGGSDKTVRLWKLEKDTHLMFNRHSYAVDAVAVVSHDRFVSGSQDGNLCLWSDASKKPLASAALGPKNWVSALGAVRRGNVVFSGSVDGTLRAWRFSRGGGADGDKSLQFVPALEPVDAPGCVNAIAVGKKILACAIGKEHKAGRWFFNKKEKNGLMFVPLEYCEK